VSADATRSHRPLRDRVRSSSRGSDVVPHEGLTPVGPNVHANKAGYAEIADTFEAIVDPR
jgi:hypothetical protein